MPLCIKLDTLSRVSGVSESIVIQHGFGHSAAEIVEEIGAAAKQRRLALGRGQHEVAQAAGVSRATLVRLEAGRGASLEAVVRIASALGAEHAFARLFPPVDARSIEDLQQPRARKRAPRKRL